MTHKSAATPIEVTIKLLSDLAIDQERRLNEMARLEEVMNSHVCKLHTVQQQISEVANDALSLFTVYSTQIDDIKKALISHQVALRIIQDLLARP